jgi:hypothetical protein
MSVILSQAGGAAVQGAVINAAGWVLVLGGILLTVLWLKQLYR